MDENSLKNMAASVVDSSQLIVVISWEGNTKSDLFTVSGHNHGEI